MYSQANIKQNYIDFNYNQKFPVVLNEFRSEKNNHVILDQTMPSQSRAMIFPLSQLSNKTDIPEIPARFGKEFQQQYSSVLYNMKEK